MRHWVIILLFFIFSGVFTETALGGCDGNFSGAFMGTGWGIKLPVSITWGIVEFKPKFYFNIKRRLLIEYTCYCSPCCKKPLDQHATCHVGGETFAFGRPMSWQKDLVGKREGVAVPPLWETCKLVLSYEESADAWISMLTVDVSVQGLDTEYQEVGMTFSETDTCGCDGACMGNLPPSVSPSSAVTLIAGETKRFTVTVEDKNGNLDRIEFGSTEEDSVLNVQLVSQTISGGEGSATFTVSYTGGELLESQIEIVAWDKCGEIGTYSIPVHIYHPPKLSLTGTRWDEYGNYEVGFRVDELILERCVQGWSCWNGGGG